MQAFHWGFRLTTESVLMSGLRATPCEPRVPKGRCGAGALQTRRQSVSLQLSLCVWWPPGKPSGCGGEAGGQGASRYRSDCAALSRVPRARPWKRPRSGKWRSAPPEDAPDGSEDGTGQRGRRTCEGCTEEAAGPGVQRCRGGCQPPQPRALEEGAEPSESF